MTRTDDAYGVTKGNFKVAEIAVMEWSLGHGDRFVKAFFDLCVTSSRDTMHELNIMFPNLTGAFWKFQSGELRKLWAEAHEDKLSEISK